MASRKAALAVLISGDSKQLEHALARANGGLDKFGKKAEHTNRNVGTSFGTMAKRAAGAGAAAVGAYASIAGAKKAIDTTTTLAKTTLSLHKNLGLSVDAASRWAGVAKSRDIDAKALNQSFVTLSKSQVAAVKGTEANVEAFRKLGISRKELKADDFETVLKKSADGLAALPAGADRAALSAKLFGKGWQTIVPILRGGSKAMEEQLALADKYGVTLKGKTVKNVEDLIAAQRESKFATMGLQVALGQELIPALTKGATAFSGFVTQMRDGTGAGGQFADVAKDIWEDAKPIVLWLGRAAQATGKFVEKHPEVGKLAAAVVGVGVAVKALRFAGAVTGFTSLLKGGRTVMRKLVALFAAEGAAAGAAAGTSAAGAEGMAGKAGILRRAGRRVASVLIGVFTTQGAAAGAAAGASASGAQGLTSAATFNKMRGSGNRLGRVMGRGLIIGLIAGVAQFAPDFVNWFKKSPLMKPQSWGESLGNAIGGFLGTNAKKKSGDGLGKGSLGGGGGSVGSLMGANSALAPIAALGASAGLHVSSGKRAAGGKTSTGGISYHGSGEALDQSGPPAAMMRFFRAAKSRYGRRLAELIYTPGGVGIKNGRPYRYTGKVAADHYDHVHAALDLGRPGPGVGDGPGRRVPGTGDGYGKSQIMNLWTRQGGSAQVANLAASVALAESGGNPSASNKNSNGSIDRGLWQINSVHGALSTFNPAANAKAAVKISSGGRNWRPWVAFTNGAYRRFLGVPGTSSSSRGGSAVAAASSGNSEQAGSRTVNSIAAPFFADRTTRNTIGPGRAGLSGTGALRIPGITSLLRAAAGRERVIGEKDTAYGQAERRFGQSDEDLGTEAGRAQRGNELKELRKLKTDQLKRQQARLGALQAAVKKFDGLIAALRKRLKGPNRAKGAAAVRIRERIRDYEDRRVELAAEALSLGSQIEDTKLDLGDIDKESATVASTPNSTPDDAAAGPSAGDKVSGILADVDLQERAGVITPEAAAAAKKMFLEMALGGQFGELNREQRLEVMAQLRDATQAQTQAASDLAQALRDVKASIDAQLAFAGQVSSITSMEAVRMVADMISGQVGQGVARRAFMPGSGTLSRL